MLEVRIKAKKTKIRVLDEDDKELGILSFYPSDFELPFRAEEGQRKLKELIEQVKNNAENMPEEAFLNTLHELNISAKEVLDYIFDDDVSQLFGKTSIFTPTTDGTMLIENIMDGIIPEVVKLIKQNTAKSSENMQKYIQDYEK